MPNDSIRVSGWLPRIGNPNAVFAFAEAQGSGAERIQGGVWIGSNTPPAWRQGTGAIAG